MSQKPAFILNILAPPGSFDVNISPDKREILLTNYQDLLGSHASTLSFHPFLSIEVLRHHLDEVFSPSRNTFTPQISHSREQTQSSSRVMVSVDQSLPAKVKRPTVESRKELEVIEARNAALELSSQRRERRSKKLNDQIISSDGPLPLANSQDRRLSHWNFDEKNLLKKMRFYPPILQSFRQPPLKVPSTVLDDNLLDVYTKKLSKKVGLFFLHKIFLLLGLS